MANPDKPVFIPQPRKDKDVNKAPEFNHNIMGRLVRILNTDTFTVCRPYNYHTILVLPELVLESFICTDR